MAAAAPLLLLADVNQSVKVASKIRWNWDWSPWATALVAAGVLLAVATIYAKEQQFVSRRVRAALFSLRSISVALVLLMLAQPAIERYRMAPPRLVLLQDVSASMGVRDVPIADLPGGSSTTGSSLTRQEAVEQLLSQGAQGLLKTLGDEFQIELVRFAATPVLESNRGASSNSNSKQSTKKDAALDAPARHAEAFAAETRLGDALDFALRQLPGPRPAAVVALTDGVNTAGISVADAAARARTLGVPVYAVGVGSDRPQPDISLSDILVEQIVFPGDRLQVEAAVRAVGFSGEPVAVFLRQVGADEPLAEAPLTLGADGQPQVVRLALRPTEPGPLRLELLIDPQPDEDNAANNRAEVTVEVREQPIRALLIDSTPRFEYRALKSLLERDPAIDLRVWLQDADPDYASVDQAALREFPVRESELLEFDVILLGDVDPQLMPSQTWELLHRFVSQHGGGLVVTAGDRFMPRAYADENALRTLLPVLAPAGPTALASSAASSAAGLRIVPTAEGRDDPSLQLGETPDSSAAIWAALPAIVGPLPDFTPKPGAQVLAVAAADLPSGAGGPWPVIMRQYVGAGEVLFHATDESWRWRWRNDDRYFARYWGQAVRRLARGRLLRSVGSLTTDRPDYKTGEAVVMRARLGGGDAAEQDSVTVELAGDATPTRQIKLTRRDAYAGLFQATLHELPADHYAARIMPAEPEGSPLTAEFVVAAPPGELSQTVVDSAGLAEAARITGGKYYTIKTVERLGAELPAAEPTAIEQLPDAPLWNSHWFLAALCVTLGLEWLIRRRSGLL